MIPAAAVEAAVNSLGPLWVKEASPEVWRATMQMALEAAAPHMQVSTQRPERGWIAKNRNTDGSVSIIGHFRNEAEAEKYAEMWPAAIVERAT